MASRMQSLPADVGEQRTESRSNENDLVLKSKRHKQTTNNYIARRSAMKRAYEDSGEKLFRVLRCVGDE